MLLLGVTVLCWPLAAQGPVSLTVLGTRSSAGEVEIVLSAIDDQGNPVRGLTKADFGISIDGRKVDAFTVEPVSSAKNPLSIVLAIDVSGSMKGAPINEAKRAASRFLDQLDRGDFTALVSFGSSVKFLTGYTQNRSEVREQIEKLVANEQWTWLYQATREVVDKAVAAPTPRSAVVLLTDGKDERSPTTEKDALGRVQGARVAIYTLAFGSNAAVDYLKALSAASGGSFLTTPKAEELSQLYGKVVDQLKNQYAIQFKFTQPAGQYKSAIELKRGGKLVASTQRDFLHTEPVPGPSQRSRVSVQLVVIAGLTFVVVVLVLAYVLRPRTAPVAAAGPIEPHAGLMIQGQVHPISMPWKGGNNPAGTVVMPATTGEVGLKINLGPTPVLFPLVDSRGGKDYPDVIVTRYDPERSYRKDVTYLLLSDPTVHRPDGKTAGHARIFRDRTTGRYQVEDLGSGSGTRLRDTSCQTALPLEDGDTITMGRVTLSYYDRRAGTIQQL